MIDELIKGDRLFQLTPVEVLDNYCRSYNRIIRQVRVGNKKIWRFVFDDEYAVKR